MKHEDIEKIIFTRNYLTDKENKEFSNQIKCKSTIYLGKRKRYLELLKLLDEIIAENTINK